MTSQTDFDPTCIGPDASINRTVITSSTHVPEELVGQDGYRALGRPFLVERTLRAIPRLGQSLDPIVDLSDLCLQQEAHALEIATDFGVRLAALLRTLKEGRPEARRSRPNWNETYWSFWTGVTSICVGGGLALGEFGSLRKHGILTALPRCD